MSTDSITDLTEEKKIKAEEARVAACQIVQDALDKRLYGLPVSFFRTCREPVDSHKFCCISTEKFLRELLAKLEEIDFKEVIDFEDEDTYAYVIPEEGAKIVYLCKLFWDSPDAILSMDERNEHADNVDSKPGTLIHEVSHLLGTVDITYKHFTVELFEEWTYGLLMARTQCVQEEGKKVSHHVEEVAQINANSVEYEFETIINHEKKYLNGAYQCCGETKRNSVCRGRSVGHYYLHERFDDMADEMKRRLEEFQKDMDARAIAKTGKMMYVKRRNKACNVICVSEH